MSELDDIAARRSPPGPRVEWLSFRIEGDSAPDEADLALFHEAFTAGMDAIAGKLTDDVRARLDLQPTLTVYPLTQCADVHRELVAALSSLRAAAEFALRPGATADDVQAVRADIATAREVLAKVGA